jgi:hypothetical protein
MLELLFERAGKARLIRGLAPDLGSRGIRRYYKLRQQQGASRLAHPPPEMLRIGRRARDRLA